MRFKAHLTYLFLVLFTHLTLYIKSKHNIEEIIGKRKIRRAKSDAELKFDLYRAGKLFGNITTNIKQPKVSVILPVFNMESYIVSAVRSVQSQTLTDIEIILVDDMSTDRTVNIVQKLMLEDKRIRLYLNKENRGTLYTRSFGTCLARGEYVTFLDPDDLMFNQNILEIAYKKAVEFDIDIVEFLTVKGNGNSNIGLFVND